MRRNPTLEVWKWLSIGFMAGSVFSLIVLFWMQSIAQAVL